MHSRVQDPGCTKSERGADSAAVESARRRGNAFAMMRTQAFDAVVCSARLATASDVFDADIGIINGNIAMPGQGLTLGKKEIDVVGRVVTSGGVDAHCHLAQPMEPATDAGRQQRRLGSCGRGRHGTAGAGHRRWRQRAAATGWPQIGQIGLAWLLTRYPH